MKPVGYLVKRLDGLEGERGIFYDYVLASNGLFIEAEGKLMAARIPVAECEVRGLAPLETKVVLRYGRIPQRFFDLAMSAFLADTNKERYVGVTWNDGYHLYVPEQETTNASVKYCLGENVVLDLHSHGKMGTFFSGQDSQDEQGMKLYGVVGKLAGTPVVRLRVGVYGYFTPISWGDVFDGYLNGVVENEEEKEVIDDHELYGDAEGNVSRLENRGGWLRWDRWFRRRRALPASEE
jgi:PRTRC genetic system protein A